MPQINYRISPPGEALTEIRVLATQDILMEARNHADMSQRTAVYGVRGIASVEPLDAGVCQVTIPLNRIGNRRRQDYRFNDVTNTMLTLNAIERAAKIVVGEAPRTLWFNSSQQRFANGRMFLMAEILKPNYPDRYVSGYATEAMLRVARAIKYNNTPERSRQRNEAQLRDSVYAVYERDHGATLETNPIGSCSIGTDGDLYRSADPTMELMAHNLYSPEQQLICLAGAMAIAECAEDNSPQAYAA